MLKDSKDSRVRRETAYERLPCHKQQGINIRIIRRQNHITQAELAKMVGLTRVAISKIERGLRRVETVEMGKIAQALGVEVGVLSNLR